MKRTEKIKLIDSTYSTEDAKEVLFALIDDKINFLGRHMHSKEERFGEDTTHIKKRIKELKISMGSIFEFIQKVEEKGYEVEITADVKLKMKKPESAAIQKEEEVN